MTCFNEDKAKGMIDVTFDLGHKRAIASILVVLLLSLSFTLFVQICLHLIYIYLVAQLVKSHPSAMWETWV